MTDSRLEALESLPSPPKVIGATGGSGTRVVAGIALRCGLRMGENLNRSNDNRNLARYITRWANRYLLKPEDQSLRDEMRNDLAVVLAEHVIPDRGPWGWKEPRSIILLPFFAQALPGMTFLHVVRDGRDMAFSRNQNQPRRHGEAVLGPDAKPGSPAGSIALWTELNLAAARFGEAELGERYLRIRYEDLCAEPEPVIARVLEFLELQGDAAELAGEVDPPASLGRWRGEDPAVVAELERVGGPALERFGYLR